ncbi:hypothetical protein G5I_05514 [Acromyrmex echinatior]|uniref:Uncharacterized protein n=1 Tax=Acromyrmex echinatior TaxID=103372 RepID=F4WIJ0_ACREC|nr:hypothetical protein G5I_05514 [Acromyrmex echinatior]
MPRGDKKNLGGEVGLEGSRATANWIQRSSNVAYNCCTSYCKAKKRREKNASAHMRPRLAYHRDLSVHLSPAVFEKVVI